MYLSIEDFRDQILGDREQIFVAGIFIGWLTHDDTLLSLGYQWTTDQACA